MFHRVTDMGYMYCLHIDNQSTETLLTGVGYTYHTNTNFVLVATKVSMLSDPTY